MRKPWPLAALVVVAVIGAGCSSGSAEDGTTATADRAGTEKASTQDPAVKFANCVRDNGVEDFPDPDSSGEFTIDEVANGSSLDTSSPAFEEAISACKDLEPPGFTGRKRNDQQQDAALRFAQCMRDNGVEDFPDPVEDGPLIDTTRIPSAAGRGALEIPGFKEATEKCGELFGDDVGIRP